MVQLAKKAIDIRKDIVTLIYKVGCGHIGGDLSVTDILVTLYYKKMNVGPELVDDPERDRFILSKGHNVEALYSILADRGFFPKSDLETYSKYQSKYIGHPNNKIGGIEVNSGSLGHGLSVGIGMAMAAKMNKETHRVYVVMGDGELAEGSVWEGAMAGGHYKLDNLTAFVDRNRLQISGTTEEVMTQDRQEERWKSFGWNVLTIDGNDTLSIDKAVDTAKETKGRPTVIIAETTKGCGVSFIENQAAWHHKVPNEEQYKQAIAELDRKKSEIDE